MGKLRIKRHPPIEPPSSKAFYSTAEMRSFNVGIGFGTVSALSEELQEMMDVLLGRTEPPLDAGVSTMLEGADAFYSRASEITMRLQKLEREGAVKRGDSVYKFRTGELRTFMDAAKRAAETGSRRLTREQLLYQQSVRGVDSAGAFVSEYELEGDDRD